VKAVSSDMINDDGLLIIVFKIKVVVLTYCERVNINK